jgi:hypothetical protein
MATGEHKRKTVLENFPGMDKPVSHSWQKQDRLMSQVLLSIVDVEKPLLH